MERRDGDEDKKERISSLLSTECLPWGMSPLMSFLSHYYHLRFFTDILLAFRCSGEHAVQRVWVRSATYCLVRHTAMAERVEGSVLLSILADCLSAMLCFARHAAMYAAACYATHCFTCRHYVLYLSLLESSSLVMALPPGFSSFPVCVMPGW